jgi:hypothetical protein
MKILRGFDRFCHTIWQVKKQKFLDYDKKGSVVDADAAYNDPFFKFETLNLGFILNYCVLVGGYFARIRVTASSTIWSFSSGSI